MQSFGTSVIDNLAAGLIVASVSAFMLWLVSPKEQVEKDIAALEPWNIGEALNAPLAHTKNYWFRGRSGGRAGFPPTAPDGSTGNLFGPAIKINPIVAQ